MSNKIQFRRGTTVERTSITPDSGEPGWDTDQSQLYVGDGATAGGIPVAPVQSVNGETGAVVLDAEDVGAYSTAAVDNLIDGRQPADSDLTAIAGLSATGLITRTGSGAAVTRTLTAGTGITVSNGNGVSGNPTVAVDATVARTDAANTWSAAQTLPALVVGRVSMPSASNVYASAGSVAYSIDVNDGWVQYWSTTGNTATLTLPPLASVTDGHIVFLFQPPTGSGTSTLKGDGSDNIDAGTTFSNTATLSNNGFSLYLCRAELSNTRWRLIKIA